MKFHFYDYLFISLFIGFIFYLIVKSIIYKKSNEKYYNPGRKLHWIVICASIISVNITFEYLVSSAANGFSTGLAFASYEWGAVLVIFFIALFFIPKYMQVGVITLPEYMEIRFNKLSRVLLAVLFVILQFGILIALLYANSMFIEKIVGISKIYTIIATSFIGGAVIFFGGMRSKIKLDIVVFFLFLISSFSLLVLCLVKVGGIDTFVEKANGRLNIILPANHPGASWITLFAGGLWILHFKYWAFYQPVAQTALVSNSLSQTQKGLFSVATLKLILPFLMIVPGIVGYELYRSEITSPDLALPVVIKNVVPSEFTSFILIGYLSTMLSAYCNFLTATSFVLSLDIVQTLFDIKDKSLLVTKICVIAVLIPSSLVAYFFIPSGLLFNYTQEIFAAVAPASLPVLLFAIFSRRTPTFAAIVVLLIGLPFYFLIKEIFHFSVLNNSGLSAVILCSFMLIMRILFPLKEPKVMPEKFEVKFERNLVVIIWGIFLLTGVLGLYMILI